MHLPRLLLIEDNEDDVFLFLRAAASLKPPLEVKVFKHPISAKESLTSLSSAPELIVTDFKMPLSTGAQLVQSLRSDPALQHVRIIVLSSSCEPQDVRAAYQAGADLYLQKPSGLKLYQQLVREISSYLDNPQTRFTPLLLMPRP